MSDSTYEALTAQVEASIENMTTALDHVANGHGETDDGEPIDGSECEFCESIGCGDTESAFDVLDALALSVEYTWTGDSRDEAEVTQVTIVTGTGGPHVEFVATIGRGVECFGYWSSSTVRRHVDSDELEQLAAELAELAEMNG